MPTFADLLPGEFRGAGLSSAELDVAQEQAGAPFPQDLCELLHETLPLGPGFPDWRHAPGPTMQAWREGLVATIHFDVVHNGFWLPEWGSQPAVDQLREAVAGHLAAAPAMIPIYAHRAIPNEPFTAGNPVFSIYQTDIILHGRDLADYLVAEFHRKHHQPLKRLSDVRSIRFWTRMLDLDDSEYPYR